MKRPLLFAVLGAGLLAVGYFVLSHRNPYPQVEWVEDRPGAGDRYVTYTPVLKTNPKLELGPTAGADYGQLSFEDVDHDGTPEVVIETDDPWLDDAASHGRQVLKHQLDAAGHDKFVLISSEETEIGDD